MATRDVSSDEELQRLRGFPDINRAELTRYLTLTGADEAFVGKFRGQPNVLGVAGQLCVLPWLGFVPDEVSAAPAAAVARLSQRLGIPVVSQARAGGRRGRGLLTLFGCPIDGVPRSSTRWESIRTIAAGVKVSIGVVHKTLALADAKDS